MSTAQLQYTAIYDISMTLKRDMVVYPNNPPYTQSRVRSSTSLVHKISLGTHSGTHIDAPNHALPDAPGNDFFPLTDFIGPCRVIDMTDVESVITVEALQEIVFEKGDRILFKTRNSNVDINEVSEFVSDFVALTPDAAEFLAQKEIALVGVDYLSIKQKGLEDNTAHTAFLTRGIPIVEGLRLFEVRPGNYQLVLLPLKLEGLDGAPCRALLLE
jgi:arylformamidase